MNKIDKVFCYFESWTQWRSGNGQFKLSHVNPSHCTHITLAFVGLNTDGTVRDLGAGPYSDFIKLKATNPTVKLLISMGGWNEGSTTYSAVRKRRNYCIGFFYKIGDFFYIGCWIDGKTE